MHGLCSHLHQFVLGSGPQPVKGPAVCHPAGSSFRVPVFHQLKSVVLLSLIFKLLFLRLANLTGDLAYPYSVCQHSLNEVTRESWTFFTSCIVQYFPVLREVMAIPRHMGQVNPVLHKAY